MSDINNICEHGQLQRKCEVCELKAEIARLRSVCREASKRVKVIGDWGICDWVEVRNIAAALADAGKEPSDGE